MVTTEYDYRLRILEICTAVKIIWCIRIQPFYTRSRSQRPQFFWSATKNRDLGAKSTLITHSLRMFRNHYQTWMHKISFPETTFLSRPESEPLSEIGRCRLLSRCSGYSLHACLETVIELERLHTSKPEPGFYGSGFLFIQSVRRSVTTNRNKPALRMRVIVTTSLRPLSTLQRSDKRTDVHVSALSQF